VGGSIVKQIWGMLKLDWEVEVMYKYREANKCAYKMANVGCSLDYETTMFEVCPNFLEELILADNMGISTSRIVVV
jgi:hypothetical protein